MSEVPAYGALRDVDRRVLCGLLHERATPAYQATYEYRWQAARAAWWATTAALAAAAAGAEPVDPKDAPPRWLATVVRGLLVEGSTTSWGGDFAGVRLVERLGLVALEPDDTYVLAVVGAGPSALTPDDPDLLDRVVWRMFEVEGGGEVSLANHDKFRPHSWQDAFVALVAAGTLPRERVLRSCLAALQRDFSAYRAGWYHRLYDALAPTAEEQAAQQAELRALLRSPVGPTVTTAVRRLRALGKAGLLDDAATVAALRPALLAPVKGTAVEAVRLLDDAAGRGAPGLVDAAAEALDHPNADVQRAAVRLLTRLGAAGVARARAATLEPSVAAGLGAAPDVPPPVLDEPPPPLAARRVVPVEGDLVERLAALLEDASDGFEVEAVLAGLAALADPEALRPLRKRAATVVARGPRDGVTPGWLRGHLARLVLGALREPATDVPVEQGTEFLVARLAEVGEVLAGGAPPYRPLATPDDGWWVRPETLLGAARPRHHDLVAALLRLAPEGRAPGGDGPVAYALGGAPPRLGALRMRLRDPALWVAAARARAPLAADPLLAAAGLRGAGRAQPLAAGVETAPATFTSGGREHTYTKWSVALRGPVEEAPADQPTALRPADYVWGNEYEDWTGWLAMTWPHDAEHFLLRTAPAVLAAADSTMVRHDAVRVLDVLATHPGRLGPLAYATLAAGLAAKRADQQVRAVDAVLARRLDPAALADGMVAVLPFCTATRWARAFGDVAAGGGGAFALAVLTALLPLLPHDLRGGHALLETLREESLRQRVRPGGELRTWLASFGGTSKAAVTARALLADC